MATILIKILEFKSQNIVEISNKLKNNSIALNEELLKKFSDYIMKSLGLQNWFLSISFVDNKEIRELNNNYRKIDKETDVLSFHYYDDFSNLDQDEVAWEVILSEEKIIEQWKEYKLWSELEFYKLFIHSTLHILWYDHEDDKDYTVMKEKEEKIWNSFFN